MNDDLDRTLSDAEPEPDAEDYAGTFIFVNGMVACTPFGKVGVETENSRGFKQIKTKTKLAITHTVCSATFRDKTGYEATLPAGSMVMVRAESLVHTWATAVMSADGLPPFVMVPAELIVAVG